MIRMVGKLLVLLAVLAMPLGMSAAGASASSMGHDSAMSHCPDSTPPADVEPGIAACGMVCSAALPAIGPNAAEPPISCALPQLAHSKRMPASILLETATPPPRLA